MGEAVISDWANVDLSAISEIIMGQSPSSSDVNMVGDGLVFFQGKAEFGRLHPVPRKYCTAPKKIAEKDDILLSVRAPVGPTNVANQTTVIGRGLAAIRASSVTDAKFLLHFFRNIEPWLSEQGTGTTFRAISGGFIKEIPFSLPPLAEQKEIANRLDDLLAQVDILKTRLDTIPAILKRFRQSTLATAVSGKLTEEWRTGGVNGKRKTVPIKSFTTKIGSGATPRGGKSVYQKSGIYLVRSMNIHFDEIKYKNMAYINEEQAKELDNAIINTDDVLLNITGASIGRVNIAPAELDGARVNQHVAIIRCISDQVLPEFLNIYLASPEAQKWILEENYGATRQALTKGMIEDFKVKTPSREEQTEIVRRVEELFAFADQIEQRVKDAQARINLLTQSILAKAFRGELTADWRTANPDLITGEN